MKNVFGNLKLAAKLGIGFGICLVLALAVGLSAISSMGKMNQATGDMAKDNDAAAIVSDLNISILQYVRAAKNLIIATTQEENIQYSNDVKTWVKGVEGDLASLKESVYTERGRKTHAELETLWKEFLPHNDKLVALAMQNKSKEAQAASLAGKSVLDRVEQTISDFREQKKKDAIAKKEGATKAAASATKTTIFLLSSAVILGILVSLYLTKTITGTLRTISQKFNSIKENDVSELTNGLRALANGDLTVAAQSSTTPIQLGTRDEFGQMSKTFDEMLEDLRGAVGSYNEAKESLTDLVRALSENSASVASTSQTLAAASQQSGAASSEIASGSDKLAQSASDAAAIVEELIAHVSAVGNSSQEQMKLVTKSSKTLDQAASGIVEVATSAQNMAAAANEGNRAVAETVDAMARVQETVALSASKVKDLDEKGQQIGAIVGTIEQIAEQTNLLALNAAIEAARAGEHGRGFAVVADEVRKLAEQAGTSTKQISELISSVKATVDDTVKAIEGTTVEAQVGTTRSEQAGQTLKEILSSAEQVARQAESVAGLTRTATDSMSAMSNAAEENAMAAGEMATGAERVGNSISGVAAVSEESAAGAEELSASIEEVSAAASELARMSQDLEAIVARFRIDDARSKRPNLKVAA